MGKKIKVGFLSDIDLHDITQLSGTSYNLRKILEENGFEVICIDNLSRGFHIIDFSQKVFGKIYRKTTGKNYRKDWTWFATKRFARKVEKRIKTNPPDVIFSWTTPILANLKTSIPKVLYTDATFNLMLGFYPNFSNFSKKREKKGNKIAKKAFDNTDLLLFSSDWAADSAITDYGISPSRVKVLTLGANIEVNHSAARISEMISQKPKNEIHLLFIGLDWVRKGGKKAVEVCEDLNRKGYKTWLHIIGTKPPNEKSLPPFVKVHGFISKAKKEGRDFMNQIFSQVHYLILPTYADCTPMVFAELNAYGIPAITHNVGGIATIVKNNKNGFIFPINSEPSEISKKIIETHTNPGQYEKVAISSFHTFKENLNWENTGKRLSTHIKSLVNNQA